MLSPALTQAPGTSYILKLKINERVNTKTGNCVEKSSGSLGKEARRQGKKMGFHFLLNWIVFNHLLEQNCHSLSY